MLFLSTVLSQVILESPVSVQVSPGSPVTLPCRTSLPVLWYKDGAVVDTEGYEDRFLLLHDGSLFFLSTTATDSGSYYCAVVKEGIEYKSDTAVLTVGDYYNEDIDIHEVEEVSITVKSDGVLVQWKDSPKAGGYIIEVRLSNAEEATKNISVEKDITTVELYNLLPMNDYIIRVLAVDVHGQVSATSQPQYLNLSRHIFVSHEEPIPTILWIVSLIIVGVITIITILAVTVLVIKIKTFKQIKTDVGTEKSYQKQIFQSKRWGLIKSPWNDYGKKRVEMKSFSCNKLLKSPDTSDYVYPNCDHYFLESDTSSNYNNSYTSNTSNHYACTIVNTDDIYDFRNFS